MVSTRHHPRQFPEPATPATRSTKTTPAKSRSTSTSRPSSPTSPISPVSSAMGAVNNAVTKPHVMRKRKSAAAGVGKTYTHVVDPVTVLWMFISVPLVFWDTGYVLLRPHSMPGGKLHSPIWTPYALYGTVDYMYGWPAFNDGVGFTSAQGSLNVIESIMYCYYVYMLAVKGKETNWYKVWDKSFWTKRTVAQGEGMALAVVLAFAGAVMTLSKTILYWLNEYFSSFENVGHNPWGRLFWLWIVPNGAWIVVPGWMMYVLGKEIVGAMNVAGKSGLEKED